MRPSKHFEIYEAYKNTRQVISEANIFSTEEIVVTVETIAQFKNVTDKRIIDWLSKAEVRYFQNNQNDQKNIQDGLIKPHQYVEGEPEWAKRTYDVQRYPQNRVQFLSHVIDYFNQAGEDYLNKLYKKTPEQVYDQEVPQWDEQMKKNAVSPKKNDLQEGVDFKVLKTYGSYKMVQLLSPKAAKCEGDSMGHCAGGYKPEHLISLYDENNSPHVTLEVRGRNVIQIKGKGNAAPVDKYKPMIKDFIASSKLQVTGDGENIGMRGYNNKYYFPDSKEWQKIWKEKILPMQQKAIKDIMDRIVVVQNEQYEYVVGYL